MVKGDSEPEFMHQVLVPHLNELQQDLTQALKNEFGTERMKCLILTLLAEFETLNRHSDFDLTEDERQRFDSINRFKSDPILVKL